MELKFNEISSFVSLIIIIINVLKLQKYNKILTYHKNIIIII